MMLSKILTAVYIFGTTLLVIAVLQFSLQINLIGISSLVLEGAGLAMLLFVCGYWKIRVMLRVMMIAFIIASIFDPLFWNMRGLNIQNAGLFSLKINGMMFVVTIVSYALGSILVKLKPQQ